MATEVIAKTNHKVEDFFRKKTNQVNTPKPQNPIYTESISD